MTAVGFEPTPFRTGAWSQRLRPLGQTVSATRLGHPGQETPSRHAACHGAEWVSQVRHLAVFCNTTQIGIYLARQFGRVV